MQKRLSESLHACRKHWRAISLILALYVSSLAIGLSMNFFGAGSSDQVKGFVRKMLVTQQPYRSVLGALHERNLPLAVLLTFFVNLSSGAFMTTTLPGIVPLAGAFLIAFVSLSRGILIGLLYYDVIRTSVPAAIVAFGTLILEFGAYVFSGAAGVNLSLATFQPKRFGYSTRRKALRGAMADAAKLYLVVVILLALGAIWEMSGILYFRK